MELLPTQNKLLRLAHKVALTSTYGRFRVGAIIARKGNVISVGTNRKKTHPIQKRFSRHQHLSPFLHAEVHAITLANAGDLEGSDVYVARALSDGSPGSSRPCSGCLEALRHYGVKNMFYCMHGDWYKEAV